MNKAQIKKQFDLSLIPEDFSTPVHIRSAFDFGQWPVVTQENPEEAALFTWGLIPSWTRDEVTAFRNRVGTVNARVETIREKPSFRGLYQNRHCLIIADGFFEFRELNNTKYPYYIRLNSEHAFTMAGLYDHWIHPQTGEVFKTFTILTTRANSLMEKIHNRKMRMPVILRPDTEKLWLNQRMDLSQLEEPFPANHMTAWTVSKEILSRKTKNDPSLATQPVVYPEVQMADELNI